MKDKASAILIISVAALIMTAGATARPLGSEKAAIVRFYELREKTLDQRGTKEDVDQLLRLFGKEARYEHPAAHVSMTLEEARAGLLSHLREGRDATFHFEKARIEQDFAVVEITLTYTVDGKQVDRRGVSVFEFNESKIVRLAEY
jgi:hypothetical protein